MKRFGKNDDERQETVRVLGWSKRAQERLANTGTADPMPAPTIEIRELGCVPGSDENHRLSLRYIEISDREQNGADFLGLV
jgi:hypothetical protein